MVGVAEPGNIRVDMQSLCGNEIAEFGEETAPGSTVLFGAFPARDDDVVSAVTFVVPDLDGVIRDHPY